MARNFSSDDVKQLISEHQMLLQNLAAVVDSRDQFVSDIHSAADAVLDKEIQKVLKEVPVETVNRERTGIRTKALRENGFETMADLAMASVHELTDVRGISEDTAYILKNVVKEYSAQVREGQKIRLSIDNKTPETSMLVLALDRYINCCDELETSGSLLAENSGKINHAIDELRPALNGFRWLFSSGSKKKQAETAYFQLSNLLSGEYGTLTKETLQSILTALKLSEETAWKDFAANPIRFFTTLEEIAPGILGNQDSMYGLSENLAQEIQDECLFPDGLLCTLRRYQEWGVKYALHQEKVLLGDEMGLGKTVQAIATMVSLKNTGATHFVVVCPASVITNWCREIQKHSLLKVTKIHGSMRKSALNTWLKNGGVAVTTFETTGYFDLAEDFRFCLLIVDEAHYIKNPLANRTIHVKQIAGHAERLLFMTGTALENKVDEMISLIRILRPELAGEIEHISFMSTAQQFREKVAPVYYRRKREDVLTELPELIENKEWCTMSKEEERIYEDTVFAKNYADIRRVSWNVDDLKNSSKARRLLEIVQTAEAENRKVIVFSFFLDTIRKIHELLGEKAMRPINGSIPPQKRQEIIDEFDQAPAGSVLLAQIQSGGTGLNIQSASVVIICEPQFKPSIENQAISRAYRMGQARNVLVYRLLCEDTVDEKIMEQLEKKQKIFDTFADPSVAAEESMELDEKSFGDIIEEEIERIQAKKGTAD